MEDIEVGEYVRTTNGVIAKVLEYDKQIEMYLCTDNEYKAYIDISDIVKHSKNIIDLIEAGDIVVSDGMKFEVLEDFCKEINTETLGIRYYNKFAMLEEIPIETILTKEQYNQNCYRLEE